MPKILVIGAAGVLAACAGPQPTLQDALKNCEKIELLATQPIPVNPAWSSSQKEEFIRSMKESHREAAAECYQMVRGAARELRQIGADSERQRREDQQRDQIEDQQREIERLQIERDDARTNED